MHIFLIILISLVGLVLWIILGIISFIIGEYVFKNNKRVDPKNLDRDQQFGVFLCVTLAPIMLPINKEVA